VTTKDPLGTLRLILGCEICTPGFIRRKLWIERAMNDHLFLTDGEDQPVP